jgi:hypothetical protein
VDNYNNLNNTVYNNFIYHLIVIVTKPKLQSQQLQVLRSNQILNISREFKGFKDKFSFISIYIISIFLFIFCFGHHLKE